MTRFAIENDRITITALVIVVVGGLTAYFTLPQDEDPGFTVRTALVKTLLPGASPDRIENLVTDKIEEAVQAIPELDFVASESRTGVSLVTVEILERYADIRPIWDNLRRKVERAERELPDEAIGPFVDDEFGDVFGVLLTMTYEGFSDGEAKEIADDVRDAILRLEEVAKVEIFGAQEERIFVEYDNTRLSELGLSVGQLRQTLVAQNIIVPGGDVRVGDERVVLEPSGNFQSLEELGRTVIQVPGRSELVYLRDVATIERGTVDPPEQLVHSNGERALAIGVSMRDGGSILALGEQIDATIERLEADLPIGIDFTRMADQPGRVEDKVDEFVGNLLQAIGIVLVVMLLFLGVRTGFVVASLVPAAMLMTLLIMQFLGVGLNQMSLAALIIALGMLIDNAIVMSESIVVRMNEGQAPVAAAVETGSELRVPLLTSSLTTSAAFLPIYIGESTSSEYTGVLFVVVSIALLSSWLLSLTMTPLLCVRFLQVDPESGRREKDRLEGPMYRIYRSALHTVLRHRVLTLVGIAFVFASAMGVARLVPNIFFPSADRTFFTAQLYLPLGFDIAATEATVDALEAYIDEELRASDTEDGITDWVAFVGGGEPRYILTASIEQPNPAYAFLLVNTSSYPVVERMIDAVRAFCDARFPEVVAKVEPSTMGPPVDKPIQVRISGSDPDVLFARVDEIRAKLRAIEGTRNVGDDWGRRTKKIVVEIDQPRARRAGVTSEDVAISLQSILSGIESTEFRERDDLIPVTLRSIAADRRDLGKLETLDVYAQATGRSVPLRQVADLRVVWQPSKILRRDRLKTVTVESELADGITANEVNAELVPWLERRSRDWPMGYRFEIGGEIETSGESQRALADKMPIAAMVIVLLLVAQFNSFRKPLIIVLTIPLGLIGVFYGLWIARSTFGFMTLLGVISLAGIVINNAIVLIDRIRIEIDENGLDPPEAILTAAQRRLRPILLTTATTLGGLLPLWIGGGPLWESMAIAIIFGLAFATVLTLGVVPVLYSLFFRISFRGDP